MTKIVRSLLLCAVFALLFVAQAIGDPLFATGTITVPGSTGNQAITGVGFQPTGILLWGSSDGTTNNSKFAHGGSDGTNQWGAYIYVEDSGAGIGFDQSSTKIFYLKDQAGTAILDGAFVSFDADGVTINWSTVSANHVIYYSAFGGDIETHVGSFTTGVATGSQSVTGVGWEPTGLIFVPWFWQNFGFSDGTNEFAWAGNTLTAATCDSRQQTTYSIYATQTAGPILEAEVTSLDSDGFTFNKATATTSVRVFYMAIKDVNVIVGTLTAPTSNGTQAVPTTGIDPIGVFLASYGFAASGSAQDDVIGNFSATASVTGNERNYNWTANDGGASQEVHTLPSTATYKIYNADTQAAMVTANMDSFGTEEFVLDWTTTDATAREIGFFALGGTTVPPASTGTGSARLLMGVGN